jgi:phosphate transport system substrate-binding protein
VPAGFYNIIYPDSYKGVYLVQESRRYVMISLAAQLFLVPVPLTLGFFLLLGLSPLFPWARPGTDAASFVLLLLAIPGSLFCGWLVSLLFSRRGRRVAASERARYLTPLLPLLYALAFALPTVLLAGGNTNSFWWALYLLKNPAFLFLGVPFLMTGLPFLLPVAELLGYTGFALGIHLQGRKSAAPSRKGRRELALLTALVLLFLTASTWETASRGLVEILYGKPASGGELTEFDLFQIAPFKEGNGLAALDGPASLQYRDFDAMPRLDGATAFYPVYASFVEAVYRGLGDYYKPHRDNYEWDYYAAFVASELYPLDIVKCSKTSRAYERLINGEADIIFVLEPSQAHLKAVQSRGDEFLLIPIAREAFVFFTNVKNPVENLTVQEIRDIYSGRITNWREVGGHRSKILPFQRPENSGSQTIMLSRVMQGVPMLEPTMETFAGGMGEMINRVAGYRNARNSLGYSFLYYSAKMIGNMQIKYLAIEGVAPTLANIRSEAYPLTVPIYAVTLKSNTKERVQEFIQWVLSPEGQTLVERTGYVSLY